MSVVFSTESLSVPLLQDMDKLMADYYDWTIQNGTVDNRPKYNFDWEVYIKAETAGLLLVTTARKADELVGFTLYMVVKAPHHDDVIVAECDSVFTSVKHQGQGIGKKLLQYTEDKLKELGVNWMVNRHRLLSKTSPLFESLGFKPWETVYLKELN